jgi:hypothetical protein
LLDEGAVVMRRKRERERERARMAHDDGEAPSRL